MVSNVVPKKQSDIKPLQQINNIASSKSLTT